MLKHRLQKSAQGHQIYICIFILLLISGCSSNPSTITYYQLNHAVMNSASHSEVHNAAKQRIELSAIKVPDYLKQSKLVLRTAPHQMHFSASNLWVQTPEKEIRTTLLADLNEQTDSYYFTNADDINVQGSSGKLFIDVSHFYPTENSQVWLIGTWSLLSADGRRTDHKFHLSIDLHMDGYGHAVAQQRALISRLAEEILTQIRGK